MIQATPDTATFLVRYGAVPEVARFAAEAGLELRRDERVVVRTHRGRELGTVLDVVRGRSQSAETDFVVERLATPDDVARFVQLRDEGQSAFDGWQRRIEQWKIDLQLVDLEWTLDRDKLVLYVLNERGPECTKLAIQAVAAGFGIVEVQPVGADGPVTLPSGGGGGCGSCGCH